MDGGRDAALAVFPVATNVVGVGVVGCDGSKVIDGTTAVALTTKAVAGGIVNTPDGVEGFPEVWLAALIGQGMFSTLKENSGFQTQDSPQTLSFPLTTTSTPRGWLLGRLGNLDVDDGVGVHASIKSSRILSTTLPFFMARYWSFIGIATTSSTRGWITNAEDRFKLSAILMPSVWSQIY